DGASAQRAGGRQQRARRQRQAPRGHAQDGGVQQGFRPLPLVTPAGESIPDTERRRATWLPLLLTLPRSATSGSWLISTRARPRRLSGSSSTRVSTTRSARRTT